jgi:ATP-dependent Clp protease ATP-binding subunit ClpA
MFERFTEEARRVVVLAQEEARAMQAAQIGPPHLLLGVAMAGGPGERALREAGVGVGPLRDALRQVLGDDQLDAEALAALGIDLAAVRERAEAAFGRGALDTPRGKRWRGGHIPFTPDAKRSLERSLRACLRRGDRAIGSDHVLLGVLDVENPAVTQVLRGLGVEAADLRRRLGDLPDAA